MYVSYGAIIVENTKLANPDISFYQATMYIEKHLLSPMYKVVKKRYSRGSMQIIFDFYTIGVIIGTVIGNRSFLFDFTNV